MSTNAAIKAPVTILLACISTGCGFIGGLDPAEKLAIQIERKSNELRSSNSEKLEFNFTPDVRKLNNSPRYNGKVILEFVVTREPDRNQGFSVISISSWFRTTYHNRFISVSKSLAASKNAGEAFQISLRKSDNGIELFEVR